MRWLGVIAAAGLLHAGCTGSSSEPPPLTVASVSPEDATIGVATDLTVRGSGFHVVIESDLDDGTLDVPGIEVRVGTQPLTGVVLVNDTTVTGRVPNGTSIGYHDVVVTMSDGRTASLPGSFRVFQSCGRDEDCDELDACVTVESCVDGRCVGDANRDTDDDGFVDGSCGGDDCDDIDPKEHPGAMWYPDVDGDGSGDPSAPGNECERAAPTDVDNALDCDDGDENVFSGSPCDDGDACTDQDTCDQAVCTGVDICMP